MKRVLFIAYLYPPIANSGTRRSIEFVNHLPDHGWQPTVLTLAHPDRAPDRYDEALLDEIRPGTEVLRAPLASRVWAERVARWVPGAWSDRLRDGLEWRLRARWTVPDEMAAWVGPAVRRAVQAHRQQRFDLVHATGSPWTSFLVAQAVARATGLPYVIDYRDPWTPSGGAAWERESEAQAGARDRLQRGVAQEAAAVVTVTRAWCTLIGGHTGRGDLHCITNGFEPRDMAGLPSPPDDGRLRIAYTGVWRPGYGPDQLYAALRQARSIGLPGLERLQVDTAGYAPGPAREHGVEDLVTEHGWVGHSEALGLMGRADVLFLPVSGGPYAHSALPGKLFEYIGTGRPILAAVPPESETARVLEEVGGACRVDPGDVPATVQALADLLARPQGALLPARRGDRLAAYTRASTARQLAALFDRVQATGRA